MSDNLFDDPRAVLCMLTIAVMQNGGNLKLERTPELERMMLLPDDQDVLALCYEILPDGIVLKTRSVS